MNIESIAIRTIMIVTYPIYCIVALFICVEYRDFIKMIKVPFQKWTD